MDGGRYKIRPRRHGYEFTFSSWKKNLKKLFEDKFRKAQNSVEVLKRELVCKFEQIVTKKNPIYGNLKFAIDLMLS